MPRQREYELADPPAAAMVEALRGIGYSLQTAVADLIDNSISAGASNVWLHFEWDGPDSWVTIADDGRGMSEKEIADAMRPGSSSPLADRRPDDLGRFGLGLKTASFSQCRSLTVTSKARKTAAAVRRWDLDYVARTNEWRVLKAPAPGSESRAALPPGLNSGTVVLWEAMDRLVGEASVQDEKAAEAFRHSIDAVRAHLGMVFHRFMEGSNPELRIFVNGRGKEHRVNPWEPFLAGNSKTERTPEEVLSIGPAKIRVQGYILPHKDQLGEEGHQKAAGPGGWNDRQGFYVYRNRRLLVPGSWLDLGWTKEEHYKLARIRIDIPNSMDALWKIDVKKSTARPPHQIRQRLRELGELVRRKAREVFSHRASRGATKSKDPEVRIWLSRQTKSRLVYEINRDHPMVAACMVNDAPGKAELSRLLRVLEETVPVHKIWLDVAERPEGHGRPFQTAPESEIVTLARDMLCALILTRQMSVYDAKETLLRMEPLNMYPEIVEALDGDCGKGAE